MTNRPEVTEHRDDVSRFMVHLTRDDSTTDPNGSPARDNFLNILASQQISALRPHCLHGRKVPAKFQKHFQVACFTECPLPQIKHMVCRIPGRRYQFEPYGFVFKRQFLIDCGAQPAVYINGYHGDNDVREAYDRTFQAALNTGFVGKKWKMLPFVNAMHDGYDFAWEREWRHLGPLDFHRSDLVCAILPDAEDDEIIRKLAGFGLPAISPEWGLERIVEELSGQQRRTKRIYCPPKPVRRVSS